jgi:ParB-like chromosome segregation protein Spo0J
LRQKPLKKPVYRRISPIKEALKYASMLENDSKAQIGRSLGVSRARVCQMTNLLRLDKSIQRYLLSIKDTKRHNYFTERRLRGIAIIKDKKEQVRRFRELLKHIRT